MKKVTIAIAICLSLIGINSVYAAASEVTPNEKNSIEKTFDVLDKISEKSKEYFENAKDYYYENDYDKKIQDTWDKTKNVFGDTKESIEENFPEETQKATEVKDNIKEKYNEVKDDLKEEKEQFDQNNPEKKAKEEEVKSSFGELGRSIKNFFGKLKSYLFG